MKSGEIKSDPGKGGDGDEKKVVWEKVTPEAPTLIVPRDPETGEVLKPEDPVKDWTDH